jgi:hypothetical protein
VCCGMWARVPQWQLVPWGCERVLRGVLDGSGVGWRVAGGEWREAGLGEGLRVDRGKGKG